MKNRLSFYTAPFKNVKTYFEMVDLAVKYGIKNLEILNLLDFCEPDIERAKKLRDYADSKGINFCCVSVGINLVGDDREKNIETTKKYADIAHILGSEFLHHTVAFDFLHPDEVVKNEDVYFKRGIQAAREIYDYAKKSGIRTICEDQGFIFNGVERFEKFLENVDRNIGVVADFGNIMFVDEEIPEFILKFSDRIVHAHVKDFKITKDIGYETRGHNHLIDCNLGEGDVDIKKACEVLKKIGYKGYISLECMNVDETQEEVVLNNIKYVEDCLK